MLIALIITLVSGTAFYSAVEGWTVVDSIYFCVMTLSTVGYGDLHPTTPVSKVFTMVFFAVGAGIFVSFITKLAANGGHTTFPCIGTIRTKHRSDEASPLSDSALALQQGKSV